MRIKVNGLERQIGPSITVAELLEELGLARNPVAVAVNREVVPRALHETKHLEEGDQVEVIQAVAGG